MRLVILESPYAADTDTGIDDNETYARACLRDCFSRGEAPFASHLLYTQDGVLDDADPLERLAGMTAGWAWMTVADGVVVYIDKGISSGMEKGIEVAKKLGLTIEYRYLYKA